MIRVFVVRLVRDTVGELHRDPEAIVVLRADLRQQLERLDAGNDRQALGSLEEVALVVRARWVSEREGDGVPDAILDHTNRLLPGVRVRDPYSCRMETSNDGVVDYPSTGANQLVSLGPVETDELVPEAG